MWNISVVQIEPDRRAVKVVDIFGNDMSLSLYLTDRSSGVFSI